MNTKPKLSITRTLWIFLLVVLGGYGCSISTETFLPQTASQAQQTRVSGTQDKPVLVIKEFVSAEGGYGFYYPDNWKMVQTGINARFVTPTNGIEVESVARLLTAVGAGEIPNQDAQNFERTERGDTVILREDLIGYDNQIIGREFHVMKNDRWYRVTLSADPMYAGSALLTNYLVQMEIIFETLYFLPETLPQSMVGSTRLRLESSVESFIYGTRMAGLAPSFVLAGYKHNIDPRVMVALASAGSRNLTNSQGDWCGDYNPWGAMGTGACQGFSSWEEAIEYVAARLVKEVVQNGRLSLADFADDSTTAWCITNCDSWLADAVDALVAMQGHPDTPDISFNASMQDFGGSPVYPPLAPDIAHINPTSTPTRTVTPTPTPTPTLTPASIPVPPVPDYPRSGQVLPFNEYVLMRWLPVDYAHEYKVELYGGPFVPARVFCDWNAASACSLGSKYPGSKIYWRIKARNQDGQESDWSAQQWFTWAYPPPSN